MATTFAHKGHQAISQKRKNGTPYKLMILHYTIPAFLSFCEVS